jgi:uncharacterized protein (UPF0261 family)
VKLTEAEMAAPPAALAEALNAFDGPAQVIVPMGGFSHRDAPGGEIEDPPAPDLPRRAARRGAALFRRRHPLPHQRARDRFAGHRGAEAAS